MAHSVLLLVLHWDGLAEVVDEISWNGWRNSHTIHFWWLCGKQPPAEVVCVGRLWTIVMVLQVTMCLCLCLLFVFGGEKKGCVLVSDVFLISRRTFGLQFIIKWCWRIEIGSGLCLKKRERREKFSVTHLKILNCSNLLNWNSVLAQFLLLQLCMMASCNKKINVTSFSLL